MKRIIYLPAVVLFVLVLLMACEKKKADNVAVSSMERVMTEAMDSVYSNPTYARKLLLQAMKNTEDSVDYYRALHTLSAVLFVQGNIDSAQLAARQIMLFAARQIPSPSTHLLRSLACNNIGNCFAHVRNQDSALYYFKKALSSYKLSGEADKMPDLYINMADMYTRSGDYAQSALHYRNALSAIDSIGMNEQMKFPVYVGLAQLYMELRDFELSDHYFHLAEMYYDARTLSEQFFFCNSRGNYYFFAEEYANALPWYQKGKALLIPGGYMFNINLVNANLGEIFLQLNQSDSAQYYLDQAEAYFSKMDELPLLYHVQTVKAGLALKQNNPQLARQYLKAENFKTIAGLEPTFIQLRNKYIQKYYARTGNYQNAYEYLLRNVAMDDSIRSERTVMRIAEIDLRYSQDTTLLKKELQIAGQASDIKDLRLRNFMWVFISLLIVALAFMQFRLLKKQKNQQWFQMQDQITRLRMLNIRNRISPHFMFNVLNREISVGNETQRSSLSALVLMLRRSLELTDSINVSLSRELEFVQAYINIEQKSLGDDFNFLWSVDPQVDLDAVLLPPMMVQIPVENAIKHALRPLAGEKILSVVVKKEGGGTAIVVEDNGAGYQQRQESSADGTGTGLRTLYQTIDLLNSMNREKMQFNIQRLDEERSGTRVYIFVPNDFKFK